MEEWWRVVPNTYPRKIVKPKRPAFQKIPFGVGFFKQLSKKR